MTRTVGELPLHALPGRGYAKTDWYRAISPDYAEGPLAWGHTCTVKSRFKRAGARFPLLYLAPDRCTALLEVRGLMGHPRSGPIMPVPGAWHVVEVTVHLERVADFRTTGERATVPTTVQELTGDWVDYDSRTAAWPDVTSDPPAPTQQLGEALYRRTCCQGFLTPSARNPVLPNLVIFPDRVSIDRQALTIDP